MVQFSLTTELKEAMGLAAECSTQTDIEKEAWQSYISSGASLDHHIIKTLLEHVCSCESCQERCKDRSKLTVKGLLTGSRFSITSDVLEKLDPRLVAKPMPSKKLQRLRERAQNREYARMVEDITTGKGSARGLWKIGGLTEEERHELMDNLYVPINLVIAMITAFVVGFFLGYKAMGGKQGGIVLGALFLVGSVLVEAVLAVINLSKQDAALEKQEKERRKAENIGVGLSNPYDDKEILLPLAKKND